MCAQCALMAAALPCAYILGPLSLVSCVQAVLCAFAAGGAAQAVEDVLAALPSRRAGSREGPEAAMRPEE